MVRFYKDRGYSGFVLADHFSGNSSFDPEIGWKDRIDKFYGIYETALDEVEKIGGGIKVNREGVTVLGRDDLVENVGNGTGHDLKTVRQQRGQKGDLEGAGRVAEGVDRRGGGNVHANLLKGGTLGVVAHVTKGGLAHKAEGLAVHEKQTVKRVTGACPVTGVVGSQLVFERPNVEKRIASDQRYGSRLEGRHNIPPIFEFWFGFPKARKAEEGFLRDSDFNGVLFLKMSFFEDVLL
jgi:hypothetical protein